MSSPLTSRPESRERVLFWNERTSCYRIVQCLGPNRIRNCYIDVAATVARTRQFESDSRTCVPSGNARSRAARCWSAALEPNFVAVVLKKQIPHGDPGHEVDRKFEESSSEHRTSQKLKRPEQHPSPQIKLGLPSFLSPLATQLPKPPPEPPANTI